MGIDDQGAPAKGPKATELSYTNNGDGSHTVRRAGRALGRVSKRGRVWMAFDTSGRMLGSYANMSVAGDRVGSEADLADRVDAELYPDNDDTEN